MMKSFCLCGREVSGDAAKPTCDECLSNLMHYGMCPACGHPRRSEMIAHTDGGSVDVSLNLVCGCL